MIFAVQGFLDTGSEETIRLLWRSLCDSEIACTHVDLGARPHITLGSWEAPVLPAELLPRLQQAAADLVAPPLALHLESYGTEEGLTASLYLIPKESRELLNFHSALHEKLGDLGTPQRPHDFPGHWAPHLSIGLGFAANRLEEAKTLCENLTYPRVARIEYVGPVIFTWPFEFPAAYRLTSPEVY